MEDVVRQAGDHAEQGQLSDVDGGFTSQGSCHEENEWLWSVLVEFHQILEAVLMVGMEDGDFRFN